MRIPSRLLAVAVALVPLPALAEEPPQAGEPRSSQETSEQEDAMFGGSDRASGEDALFGDAGPSAATPPAAAPSGEDANLVAGDSNAYASAVAAVNDKLQIGGRALFQGAYLHFENSPREPQDESLSAPSLLDVYFDGRPNDRLRFYGRGRLSYSLDQSSREARAAVGTSAAITANPSAAVDQLWLNFDLDRKLFVTLGKQRIRWGAGRFWNPTDFLNQQRLNPLTVFDLRLGAPLVKLHVPVESLGWNFYGIVDLQTAVSSTNPTGQLTPASVGGAVRAELLLGPVETALTAYLKPLQVETSTGVFERKLSTKLGADFSFPLGPLDLRLESALLHDPSVRYWEGELDFGTLTLPTLLDRSDQWIPQVVAGVEYAVQYSEQDSVTFSAEYFFNDAGYSNKNLYPWLLFNGVNPLYLGRQYLSLGATLLGPGNLNDTAFIGQALTNLNDGSWLSRLIVSQAILTNLSLSLFLEYHFGNPGEFRQRLEIPAGLLPQAPNGLVIPAQQFNAFLSLSVVI
jgi:hypothetical protein